MTDSKKPEVAPRRSPVGLIVLFAVLIAWALIIAFGSFQTQASTDVRRPVIVIACMTVFLGGWGLALWARKKK